MTLVGTNGFASRCVTIPPCRRASLLGQALCLCFVFPYCQSGWRDSNPRQLGPKPRALARLSYAPEFACCLLRTTVKRKEEYIAATLESNQPIAGAPATKFAPGPTTTYASVLRFLLCCKVRLEGFEPPTLGTGNRCSIP